VAPILEKQIESRIIMKPTISYKVFITHKQGESKQDCQDAYDINKEKYRYAIADGATQSFYSAYWSRFLVEHFCSSEDTFLTDELLKHKGENWYSWLEPIQLKWHQKIKALVEEKNKYFITNRFKRRESAVSTFIGIEINFTQSEVLWHSLIIGDSCLLHIKDGNFHKSYLFESASQFTSKPEFFSSYAQENIYEPKFLTDSLGKNDVLLLATDAIAKWLIQQKERGQESWISAWNSLLRLKSQIEFEDYINDLRQCSQSPLDNDDVTILLIYTNELDQKLSENSIKSSAQYLNLATNTEERKKVELSGDSNSSTTQRLKAMEVSDSRILKNGTVKSPKNSEKNSNDNSDKSNFAQLNKKMSLVIMAIAILSILLSLSFFANTYYFLKDKEKSSPNITSTQSESSSESKQAVSMVKTEISESATNGTLSPTYIDTKIPPTDEKVSDFSNASIQAITVRLQ